MEQMKTIIEHLQNEIANKDAAISHYKQITTKMENTLQEIPDEIAKISGDMCALGDKVARLEIVNDEMESYAWVKTFGEMYLYWRNYME